jgi:hypothetical protein
MPYISERRGRRPVATTRPPLPWPPVAATRPPLPSCPSSPSTSTVTLVCRQLGRSPLGSRTTSAAGARFTLLVAGSALPATGPARWDSATAVFAQGCTTMALDVLALAGVGCFAAGSVGWPPWGCPTLRVLLLFFALRRVSWWGGTCPPDCLGSLGSGPSRGRRSAGWPPCSTSSGGGCVWHSVACSSSGWLAPAGGHPPRGDAGVGRAGCGRLLRGAGALLCCVAFC